MFVFRPKKKVKNKLASKTCSYLLGLVMYSVSSNFLYYEKKKKSALACLRMFCYIQRKVIQLNQGAGREKTVLMKSTVNTFWELHISYEIFFKCHFQSEKDYEFLFLLRYLLNKFLNSGSRLFYNSENE